MSPLNPLNPATGDVPVPEDPREIDAALHAGNVSLRIFPYLDWRYGERGRKFTQSDSAWLVWLTRHDPEHVYEQITWLRSVLSNRGMPGWILETHLSVLHRHLTRRIPENGPKYFSLETCATRLRQVREDKISAERTERLVSAFVAALQRKPSYLLNGAAWLMIAAVADEQDGVKNAVSSLETWLADAAGLRRSTGLRQALSKADRSLLESASFQQLWQDAVAATIADARGKQRR